MTELVNKIEIDQIDKLTQRDCKVDPDRRIEPNRDMPGKRQGQIMDADKKVGDGACSKHDRSGKVDVGSNDIANSVMRVAEQHHCADRLGQVSFKGFTWTRPISDIQIGPTCWANAMENVVQLMSGDTTGRLNNLSEVIYKMVSDDPKRWSAVRSEKDGPMSEWNIPFEKYPEMLREFQVESSIERFSHKSIQKALAEHRPVLVCGDVKHLKQYKGEVGGHALVAVDYDPRRGVYTLLDSNFENAYEVDKKTLEKFAKSSLAFKLRNWISGNMIVAKDTARWPWKTFHFSDKGRNVSFGSGLGTHRGSFVDARGHDVSFGGGLGASELVYLRGSDKISEGRRKIAEGKVSAGNALIREGEHLIAESKRMKERSSRKRS